jgi:hypothetical protein
MPSLAHILAEYYHNKLWHVNLKYRYIIDMAVHATTMLTARACISGRA